MMSQNLRNLQKQTFAVLTSNASSDERKDRLQAVASAQRVALLGHKCPECGSHDREDNGGKLSVPDDLWLRCRACGHTWSPNPIG